MRNLLKTLETALPNFPSSALRLFDEWVARFDLRFEDTFRPVACSMNGSTLTLNLDAHAELVIDTPSNLTISPEIFRIGHARAVRFHRTRAQATPPVEYFIDYALHEDMVTRRDGVSSRSFPYHLELAAVEFVAG